MHAKRYAILTLIAFSLILTQLALSTQESNEDVINEVSSGTGKSPVFRNINEVNDGRFTISQVNHAGVINPVSILQSGYQTTELKRGRTDTGGNTAGNITIDEANGWFVNSTGIEVTGLKRLYGLNGTFDDGTDPWIPYTIDGGANTQINSYNSTGGFIVCRNMGNYNPSGGGYYTHSELSEAGWEQVVTNTPESLTFKMEFNFRYVTGPLDPEGDDSFAGDVGVFWQLGSEGYYYPMQEFDSRETWYSVSHVFTVSPGLSTFSIYVGLYIGGGNVRVYINNDYDDDGVGDGIENAQNVTVYIDNVEFTSTTSPDFEDVGLSYHAGALSAPILGTETGTATITNPDFWNTSPLEYQITASANVLFTYSVTSLFQRYINSSWTTSLSSNGVSYSISSGMSSDLTFYTYITQPSGYYDSTFDILFPRDWENTTVWDPLMNNITSYCDVQPGKLHIPTSELSRSGWWEINLNGLNYAKNISVQVFDQDLGQWSENSLFRPGNETRIEVEIGTPSITPVGSDPVNITWFLPNEDIWTMDSITTMTGGAVTSSRWTFGSTNTTAGEWLIDILWTNGTEIAYQSVSFDLYHSASITATYPIIESDYGQTISNLITLKDADTNEFLLDDSVTIEANWSSSIIEFTQNYAKKWWEADFDTSLIGGGEFTVLVTASRPYFDTIITQFTVISLYRTTLEIVNTGSIPIENGLNEVFTAQIDYEFLNGTGIIGALPIITFSGPVGGLSWTNFIDNDNGHYSVDIICDIATTYGVTITLSKPYHYNSSDSFTLIISETGTELESLNGTADVVRFGDSYRLVVEYRNSTGQGLSGADLEIVSITPQTGLINGTFIPITSGYYEITLTPTTTGTYSIVISASLFNHETQYITFTLTGVVIPTILTSIPSSATVAVNQSFTLQLLFQDENLNPIDLATITDIDPPSGILISGAIPIGSGLYNITLKSSDIATYNLLFRASAVNYQSSIVGFTLSVTAIQTTLEILNAGSIPVENGLNEIFRVQLSYQLLNGSGVAGALPTIIFTGPQEGLSWTNFSDNDNGLYSLDIKCNVSAIYGISITLSKAFYYSTTDAFTLIIDETDSELLLLNGTVDVVLFGSNYTLVVEFRNSTGTGLAGANLQVVTITPASGLTHDGFSHIIDGYYQITLTPTAAGAFSIVISASIINHVTQYKTFTLTATGIPTILTSLPSSASIAFDQTFTVQLHFQDENLNPIDFANFTVTNPPSGLIISEVVSVGPGTGLYNFTLTPIQIGTFNILFRSSIDNYQSSSAAFTLIVTEIETRIEFAGGVSSALVEFQESYQLIVYYYRTDLATLANVNGANVSVFAYDPGLNIVVNEVGGYYLITITGQTVGTWFLTISANKTDHYVATKQFLFEVAEIDTSIEGSNPLESLFVGRSYLFNFTYMIKSNSSHVFGADITPLGEGADWISVVEMGSGQYSIALTPALLGSHSIILVFGKYGFETASFRLTFSVSRVPISVEILEGLSGLEKTPTTLRVSITEANTENPVTNATVFYRIRSALTEYADDPVRMTESNIPGIYIATLTMPDADSEYLIQISCEAENYELDEPLTMPFRQTRSFTSLLIVYSERYWWIIFGIVAIVGAVGYRRSARKRRIKQNKITLAIKKRFDDVRSLLGVIVLHKDSGLPVYSKILREGLEESVISAFISAITSFRGEFDIETTTEEWGLIPISDIVRVVSTNKLICAFITTSNPSPEQRERMIKFAKTVGFIFDETMEDVPVVILDQHTTKQFNALFDDILDGSLLRIYKLDEDKKFATATCADERIARKQGEEFKLEELASEIAACGLEEGRVYQAIMRALENHYLVATDESPFATKIIRAPDTVAEEG